VSSRSLVRQVALLLACLVTAAIILGLYGDALNVDASTFLVVGRGWIAGVSPYSGLWDDKPPAIYILAAITSLLDRHGDGVIAFRALSIGSVAATALTVDSICRRLTGRVGAGIASAFLISLKTSGVLVSVGRLPGRALLVAQLPSAPDATGLAVTTWPTRGAVCRLVARPPGWSEAARGRSMFRVGRGGR
jgi:hypothetical protein